MPLTVRVPGSAEEALADIGEGGLLVGGGTAIMPRLNNAAIPDATLVSLRRADLDRVDVADGIATLGAAATLAAIGRAESLGFLHPAISSIASPSVRNLATVGGNLFVSPPYGDLAVCLLALDAEAEVRSSDAIRRAPIADILDNGIRSHEIVTQVAFRIPEPATWFFTKAMRRRQNSAAIVTVAAVVRCEAHVVAEARVALGGAGARPVRSLAAEAALIGRTLDREAVEAAGAAAAAEADPQTDAYASAWYRRRVLPVHIRRALLAE